MKLLLPSILRRWLAPPFVCALFLGLFLVGAISSPALPQEPTPPSQSVADAARKAQAGTPSPDSTKPAKVLTNDDLSAVPASPPTAASPSAGPASTAAAAPGGIAVSGKESASTGPSEGAKPICPNENEEQIKSDLQAAQEELDQLRGELSANGPVISNGDVDLTNFKPGSSGVSLGSPPLSQSTPEAPGRVREVELEEKVASLKKAARLACESGQEAKIQQQFDSAKSRLEFLQQQFSLDQSAFYSKPDYAGDASGKAKLDDEQQQIQALQEEVDRLREQLPAESSEPAPE